MNSQPRRRLFTDARDASAQQDDTGSGGNTMARFRITILAVLLVVLSGSAARAVGQVPQVNLILDDGVVLIYKGADHGFKPGDFLDVVRGGQVVGRLQVLEVFPTFTRAKIVGQEKTIEVFDIVAPAAPGSVLEKKEKPAEEKKEKKEEKKEEKPKKEPKEKKEEKKEEPKAEKKEEPKKQEPQTVAVAAHDKFYTISMGYFFLNQDFDTDVVDQPGTLGYGVDYWMRQGDSGAYLVAGYFASNPEIKIATTGAPATIKNKFWSFSLSYVMDSGAPAGKGKSAMYYGVGAAYRSLELDSEGLNAPLLTSTEREVKGTDYHLLLGYRFGNDAELKGLYSFDEKYYSMSLAFSLN
jgi:hypothetical protein